MFLRTQILEQKKLTGISLRMSLMNNRTAELWQWLQPKRKNIRNVKGNDLYSLEVYDSLQFFERFDPANEFTKWAAVEVNEFDNTPNEMQQLTLEKGLYAVFLHKGTANNAQQTYGYIFREWLPGSAYKLDDRAHFALMGEKYKANSNDSEEEIWIPIKPRNNE